MAFAAAIPYILQGASLVGGMMGKKKKAIDPEWLREHFGAKSIADETQKLANFIMNSPYGQQLMASAAESGQALQNDMAVRASQSGLSPEAGGQSPVGDFATSAAGQAQSGYERQVRSGVTQSAMPIAAGTIGNTMQAWLASKMAADAQPTTMQQIGAAAGQAASMAPPTAAPSAATAAPAAAPMAVAAPAAVQAAGTRLTMPTVQTPSALSSLAMGRPTNTGFEARHLAGRNPAMRMVNPRRLSG